MVVARCVTAISAWAVKHARATVVVAFGISCRRKWRAHEARFT